MNTPNQSHLSVAETVLAEVQTIQGTEAAATEADAVAPDQADVEATEETGDAVELVEEAPGEESVSKSLSWDDAVRRVPPDIARLMREMRKDYTQKTQQVAEQRREFLREREALLRGKDALKDREEVPEYDPFNEESITARIETEVNRRLREVLEPMEAEYQTMQAEENYQRFLSEHGDFKTDSALRSEVQHLLEANSSLDLETAYYAAKGKQARLEAKKTREETSATRRARKQAASIGTGAPRKGGRVAKPKAGDLRKMSAADILAIAQQMHRN